MQAGPGSCVGRMKMVVWVGSGNLGLGSASV